MTVTLTPMEEAALAAAKSQAAKTARLLDQQTEREIDAFLGAVNSGCTVEVQGLALTNLRRQVFGDGSLPPPDARIVAALARVGISAVLMVWQRHVIEHNPKAVAEDFLRTLRRVEEAGCNITLRDFAGMNAREFRMVYDWAHARGPAPEAVLARYRAERPSDG